MPHVGWNSVRPNEKGGAMFRDISGGAFFYFNHSYCVSPSDGDFIAATADYGVKITAAVAKGKIWGVQFHPEKSASDGLKLLENFAKIC